jgi:hypothetical protein
MFFFTEIESKLIKLTFQVFIMQHRRNNINHFSDAFNKLINKKRTEYLSFFVCFVHHKIKASEAVFLFHNLFLNECFNYYFQNKPLPFFPWGSVYSKPDNFRYLMVRQSIWISQDYHLKAVHRFEG